VYTRLRDAISKLGTTGYVPGSSASKGWLYNPLPFPGCDKFPCHRANSGERWDIIARHTNFKGRSVLDVGCATGYFSFKAVQAGAVSALGIDRDPAAVGVCKAAAEVYSVQNARFECISMLPTGKYDIIFAMSILNWIGKDKTELWLSSSSLDRGTVWIEMPLKGDGRRGASWLATDDDVKDWLEYFFSSVQYAGRTYGTHCRRWRALWKCC